ncbi:unnamed protein product, partial [Ceratitis capitata]
MFRRRSAFETPLRPSPPNPPEIRVNHLPVTDYCTTTTTTKKSALIRAALQQRAKGRSLSNSPINRKKKFHHLPILFDDEAGEATLSVDEHNINGCYADEQNVCDTNRKDKYNNDDNDNNDNNDSDSAASADLADGARHSRHHVSRRDHTRNLNSFGNSLGTTRYNRLATGPSPTATRTQSGHRQYESTPRSQQQQQQYHHQPHQQQSTAHLHHPLVRDRRESIATSRPTINAERSPIRECILVRRRSDFTDREYQEYLRECKKHEYEQQYPEHCPQKQTHLHPYFKAGAQLPVADPFLEKVNLSDFG